MLAQIGPGKGDGTAGNDDFGRMRVTGDPADQYAFRTIALRNVELSGPFGHAGQYVDLEQFVRHYSAVDQKLAKYDVGQLEAALQTTLVDNFAAILATADSLVEEVKFLDIDAEQLTAFMLALTDEAARDLTSLIPATVPSGLPIDR